MSKPQGAAIFPPYWDITPVSGPLVGSILVPGSKSITNRALILAALAGSPIPSLITGALFCEDSEVMVQALKTLGFRVEEDWAKALVRVWGQEGTIPANKADLFVANSGTSMRFLTALVALGQGTFRLDGIDRMRQRPIRDLVEALGQLGVMAECEKNGCPPVVIKARGLAGGPVTIRANLSSQFLSGLLMAAPLARQDMEIRVEGELVSAPYVTMTLAMMRAFGAKAQELEPGHFQVPGGQTYKSREYGVEPDASAASYFAAAAAITGGTITLEDLHPHSLQGDIRFLEVLEKMGCTLNWGESSVRIQGGPLVGLNVDMKDISDTVMTLAAVACFAQGKTTITNVGHIRHKETDRLEALATELQRLGVQVHTSSDSLTIHPRPLRGAEVETYNDHRMAMSLALVGLKVPGVRIRNPQCVTKTYPGYFTDLERLRCGPAAGY